MEHFTELWTKLRPKRLKDRAFKDRDALKGVAKLMAEGKLLLKARRSAGGGGGKSKDKASAPPPPQRRPQKTWQGGMKIRERPDPAPASQPPPPIDVAKQVEALLSAAKSGAPFVKQCNK
ncbi:MAG: hypothetical protein L3J36_09290 [Rhodobacteraceae bacterium]|nr:hypothetical protein [Paracoccaceae bacterium]